MEGARNGVKKREEGKRQGLDCEGVVHPVGKSTCDLVMGGHEGFSKGSERITYILVSKAGSAPVCRTGGGVNSGQRPLRTPLPMPGMLT